MLKLPIILTWSNFSVTVSNSNGATLDAFSKCTFNKYFFLSKLRDKVKYLVQKSMTCLLNRYKGYLISKLCGTLPLTKWFLIVSYVVSATSNLPLKVLCKVSSLVLPWKSPILKCPHVSSSSFQLYMTDPGLTIKKVPDTLQMLSLWKERQDLVHTRLIIIMLLLSPLYQIHLMLSFAHCLNCWCYWGLEKYIKNNTWAHRDVEFLSKCCATQTVTIDWAQRMSEISSWPVTERNIPPS